MPRMGRVMLPEYPHHIVQRGYNRNVVFAKAADYQRYLATLVEFREEYGVSVYAYSLQPTAYSLQPTAYSLQPTAYSLMTCHVNLLLAPRDHTRLGALVKRLAGRNALPKPAGRPERHVVGKPIQVQPSKYR